MVRDISEDTNRTVRDIKTATQRYEDNISKKMADIRMSPWRGQEMEAALEQYSQVTESVAVEEDETGDSVMSVEESAGAERFQPSPSGTPGRNIPTSLSLPLERDPASTHFWTANSARKYY